VVKIMRPAVGISENSHKRKIGPDVFASLGMAAAVVLVTGTAVAAPLLAYSVTLASFGAAHVLSELRYVDLRFGRVLGAYGGLPDIELNP
jgi:hypothetical protein